MRRQFFGAKMVVSVIAILSMSACAVVTAPESAVEPTSVAADEVTNSTKPSETTPPLELDTQETVTLESACQTSEAGTLALSYLPESDITASAVESDGDYSIQCGMGALDGLSNDPDRADIWILHIKNTVSEDPYCEPEDFTPDPISGGRYLEAQEDGINSAKFWVCDGTTEVALFRTFNTAAGAEDISWEPVRDAIMADIENGNINKILEAGISDS